MNYESYVVNSEDVFLLGKNLFTQHITWFFRKNSTGRIVKFSPVFPDLLSR